MTRPAGTVSLNVRLLRAGAAAAFAIVKVSVATWPTPRLAGAKAFVSEARLCTVRPLAVTALVTRAVAPMFAAALVYGPPTTLDVTSTVTTHEACAALIVAPVTVTLPAAVVTAPAPDGQGVVTFGAAATTTFAGSVSVKLMPPCAGLPEPLVSVKVSV